MIQENCVVSNVHFFVWWFTSVVVDRGRHCLAVVRQRGLFSAIGIPLWHRRLSPSRGHVCIIQQCASRESPGTRYDIGDSKRELPEEFSEPGWTILEDSFSGLPPRPTRQHFEGIYRPQAILRFASIVNCGCPIPPRADRWPGRRIWLRQSIVHGRDGRICQ